MKDNQKNTSSNKNNCISFNEHLDRKYGKIGSAKRNEFEKKAKLFVESELEKEKTNSATQSKNASL